jgi:transcriptional regulator with XRE-family HTH domain
VRDPHKLSQTQVLELRRRAGRWLKQRREGRGLSQRALAGLVGLEYYTFISQLEAGRGRISPENYLAWAKALGVEPKIFVRTLFRYYDPVTHGILFGKAARQSHRRRVRSATQRASLAVVALTSDTNVANSAGNRPEHDRPKG